MSIVARASNHLFVGLPLCEVLRPPALALTNWVQAEIKPILRIMFNTQLTSSARLRELHYLRHSSGHTLHSDPPVGTDAPTLADLRL
jgi:hypothetical protein